MLIVDDDAEVREPGQHDARAMPACRRAEAVQRPRGARLARRQRTARSGAARPDDAGDGRLPVPGAAARRSDADRYAGRGADRQGLDRRGTRLPRRAHRAGARQIGAADHQPRHGAGRHCDPAEQGRRGRHPVS